MTEAAQILDSNGKPIPRKPKLPEGACQKCSAPADSFRANFGGVETCMKCGHQREREAAPRG